MTAEKAERTHRVEAADVELHVNRDVRRDDRDAVVEQQRAVVRKRNPRIRHRLRAIRDTDHRFVVRRKRPCAIWFRADTVPFAAHASFQVGCANDTIGRSMQNRLRQDREVADPEGDEQEQNWRVRAASILKKLNQLHARRRENCGGHN